MIVRARPLVVVGAKVIEARLSDFPEMKMFGVVVAIVAVAVVVVGAAGVVAAAGVVVAVGVVAVVVIVAKGDVNAEPEAFQIRLKIIAPIVVLHSMIRNSKADMRTLFFIFLFNFYFRSITFQLIIRKQVTSSRIPYLTIRIP